MHNQLFARNVLITILVLLSGCQASPDISVRGTDNPIEVQTPSMTPLPISTPTVTDSCRNEYVQSIDFDRSGNLLVATLANILKLDLLNNKLSAFDNSKIKKIHSIKTGGDDAIWVSSENGVWRFANREWVQYLSELSGRNIILLRSVDGKIWVQADGLYQFDNQTWSKLETNFQIGSVAIVSDKDIWVSQYNGYEAKVDQGVWRFDGISWEKIPELSDSSSFYIIASRSKGVIWFVSNRNSIEDKNGKVIKYENGAFHQILDLTDMDIHSIVADADGNLWIVKAGGILKIDSQSISPVELPIKSNNPLEPIIVTTFAMNNQLYCFGTNQDGIWCNDHENWENYKVGQNCK